MKKEKKKKRLANYGDAAESGGELRKDTQYETSRHGGNQGHWAVERLSETSQSLCNVHDSPGV